MGYYKCLVCGYTTGKPDSHSSHHEPQWERCTCGSGAHPRKCDLHPLAYEQHIKELNEEINEDE